MSASFQIVPWYNVEEWREVYNILFASNSTPANKRKGLEHLLIWKARCPTLPSAIESTLILLEVQIQDITSHVQTNSDSLMRLAYSSALMRFVNHMLDSETSKGLNLFRAAKNIGIPDWIIELRHDAAHSERLPSIEQLREASLTSLEWLQKYYWDKHNECIENYILEKAQDGELENKIEGIISFYLSLSICSHSQCKIRKVCDIEDKMMRDSLVNDAKDILGASMNFSNLESITIHSLIEAMKVKAKKLPNSSNLSEYVNKVLISEGSLFLSLEVHHLLDSYNLEFTKSLSKQYIKCFVKLLEFLHTKELLQDVVLGLIKFTQSEEICNKKHKLAARWVSTILQAWRKNQQFTEQLNKIATNEPILDDEKKIKSLYYQWYPNEKENILFLDLRKCVPNDMTNMTFIQPIISTYNPNVTYFIKDLLHLVRPCLPTEAIDKICSLAKVIACPEKFPITSSRIYTVDDLMSADSMSSSISNNDKNIAKECNKEHNKNNVSMDHDHISLTIEENQNVFGIWQMASNNQSWGSCPIGTLPWQLHTELMET